MPRAASSVFLILLDITACALTILFVAILAADGFVVRIAEIQVSFRTPWRTLLWLAAVVIVRLLLDRRTPPFAVKRTALDRPRRGRWVAAASRWPRYIETMLVVGLFCVPLFLGLQAWDLQNDEAIYSYAVDRIIETGDWLTPRAIPEDTAFLEKPPLKFWLVAGAIRAGLLPHNEFGLRFFDALFGAIAFLYVLRFGQWLAGPWCGFIACLVLFTLDALVFDHGLRSNNMDAALFLAYCGGMYHFARWAEETSTSSQRRHALIVGVYFALGFMTKFVAVFFLPLVCAIAFLWRRDGLRRLRTEWHHWAAPSLVALAIIAPWFVYQTYAGGSSVWREMFGIHVYERFTAVLEPAHLKPWHFYYSWTWGELVFAGSHWIVLGGLLMLAWRAWTGQPWAARLVFVWVTVPSVLLAITTSKLSHYAYPFLPPLALGAGWAVITVFRGIDRRLTIPAPPVARRAAAIAVVVLMLPVSTYALQAKHLFSTGAPIRALRDCAVSVRAVRETRVYMPYWNRLMNHAFYYYLRRIGPWVQTDHLDPLDLQRRLSNPVYQTFVVVTQEDYEVLPLAARVQAQGVAFPERVVVLTPGRFSVCGAEALAAGGTPIGQGSPPRGRHWH